MKKIKGLWAMAIVIALPALFSLAGCFGGDKTAGNAQTPAGNEKMTFADFMSSWGLIILIAVLVLAWFFFSGSRRKKQAQEGQNMLNSIQPGTYVMTQGGVIGKVVEVKVLSATEKHVVLETGGDEHKSYITYDIRAIGLILRPEQLVARTTPLESVMPTDEEVQKRLDEVYSAPAPETVPAAETIFEIPSEPVADTVAEVPVVKKAAVKKTTAKKKEKTDDNNPPEVKII